MSDTLGPTPEQLRKGTYEPPSKDRDTNRVSYRKVGMFEQLHNRGELEYCHVRAAERLIQHVEGSLGHDVRILDPWEASGGGKADEFPRTRHANELADAINQLLPREWSALKNIIHGIKTIEQIGRETTGGTYRQINRAHGLRIVTSGLERLAYHWDFISKKERV